MTMTLYGMGHSRSFRCLWALEEAKLDYNFVNLDFASAEDDGSKSPTYLKLNTQGKVPTLVHNDFVLIESAAIVNYINACTDKSFIPQAPQDRAKYDELAFFVLTELEQPLWTTGKHKFAIPAEYRVPEVLATAKWEFQKALNTLPSLCAVTASPNQQGGFALGNEFSFADILLAQTFNWADRFKFDVPKVYLDYRDTMYSRPAAKRALDFC
ncbi:MAG: glutathione S-transferase family protein [Gammaproteobacteria bacterium]|nr:glutathione S-transferase family protein [Gammaproteobacteria bacterium]